MRARRVGARGFSGGLGRGNNASMLRRAQKWIGDRPRLRRWLVYWGPGAAGLYMLMGFVGVPALIEKVVVPRVEREVLRQGPGGAGTLSLARARFNPLRFRLELEGIEVRDTSADGGRVAASVDGVVVNFDPLRSVLSWAWTFKEARVRGARVHAQLDRGVDGAGVLNLVAMLREPAAGGTGGGGGAVGASAEPMRRLPRVRADVVRVEGGRVRFVDTTTARPVGLEWGEIEVVADGLDTRWDRLNEHSLTARSDAGERVEWRGTARTDPMTLVGTLRAEGLQLARVSPYVERVARVRVEAGRAGVSATYEVAPAATPRRAVVRIESAGVEDARTVVMGEGSGGEDRPLAGAARVEASGIVIDADARRVEVGRVAVGGGWAHARREADGVLEATRLMREGRVGGGAGVRAGAERAAGVGVGAVVAEPEGGAGVASGAAAVDVRREPMVAVARAVERLVSEAGGVWEVEIGGVEVEGSSVAWRDEAARAGRVVEIGVEEGSLRTTGAMRLSEGFAVGFEGRGRPSFGRGASVKVERLDPRGGTLRGSYEVDGLEMAAVSAYAPERPVEALPALEVAGGTVTSAGSFEVGWSSGLSARLEGTARVTGTRVVSAGGGSSELLSAEALESTHRVEVRVSGEAVEATVSGTGSARGVSGDLPEPLALRPRVREASWEVGEASVGGGGVVKVEGVASVGGVEVEAGRLAGPVRVGVEGASVVLRGSGGGVDGVWTGTLRPRVSGVSLEGPEVLGPVRMSLGVLETSGAGVALEAGGDGVRASVEEVTLGELRVEAEKLGTSDAGWTRLELTGVEVSTSARSIEVRLVEVVEPGATAAVVLFPERLDRPPPPGVASVTAADLRNLRPMLEALSAYRVGVDEVVVSGGRFAVRDPTLSPPLETGVEAFEARVTGFSTDARRPKTIRASGRVGGAGTVAAEGTVDLSGASATSTAEVRVLSLATAPLSGVSSRFTGFENTEGRLTLSVPVSVENDVMKGRLVVGLERFELGDRVEAPDAIKLPIKLGLAVMKDSRGRIDATLPFEGRLDDPEFSVGGVIWQAVVNLLGKAATSPFRLLAGLVGSEDVDLSVVGFEAGVTEVTGESAGRLDLLARALRDRPGLRVRVVGHAGGEADLAALRSVVLRERLTAGDTRTVEARVYEQRVRAAFESAGLLPAAEGRRGRAEYPPMEEMERLLAEREEVPRSRLVELAERRAAAVVRVLGADQGIAAERLRAVVAQGEALESAGSRVTLELEE